MCVPDGRQQVLSLGMDLQLEWMRPEDFQKHLTGADEHLAAASAIPSSESGESRVLSLRADTESLSALPSALRFAEGRCEKRALRSREGRVEFKRRLQPGPRGSDVCGVSGQGGEE